MTESHERLDEVMEARRLDLRMSWSEVARAAGISPQALRSIRRGDSRPSRLTARALDAALQWEPGSVEVVLAGGAPTLHVSTKGIPSAEAHGKPTVTGKAGADLSLTAEARGKVAGKELTIEERLELLDRAYELIQQARRVGKPEPTPEDKLREELAKFKALLAETVEGMSDVADEMRREAS